MVNYKAIALGGAAAVLGGISSVSAYTASYTTSDLVKMFQDLIGVFVGGFIDQGGNMTEIIVLLVLLGLLGSVLVTILGMATWALAKLVGLGGSSKPRHKA